MNPKSKTYRKRDFFTDHGKRVVESVSTIYGWKVRITDLFNDREPTTFVIKRPFREEAEAIALGRFDK